jgi:Ser/Thr protein kinase RdoA (MazF antagonist)
MKPFHELSRRGRLFQLKKMAVSALAPYGLEEARLRFVQYNENAIYRVDVPDPITVHHSVYLPNRYVLRIHAIGDVEAIASELTWLEALNREGDLPVPAPVPTSDGKLVERIVSPCFPNGRLVSLLRWLEGRKIHKGFAPHHLRALGQVVARLHDFSANWQPPADFSRFVWDWDALLGGSMFSYPRAELVTSMPVHFQEPFECVSNQARQVMETLGKGTDAYGLIHGDLYPENVLFKGGSAFPIDFEDCGYGYWMWDIAVALCTWTWDRDWERMRDAFREGYSRYRMLPESQWALLDLFAAAQFAIMVLWASCFLKSDPVRITEYEPWRNRNGNKLIEYFNR